MPSAIIKIKDKYFEWSTISDAPQTYGMTLDELKEYVKEEYGNRGLRELQERFKRVEEKGHSFIDNMTLDDILLCNRAGPDEAEITKEQIYEIYSEEKGE